jgi:purine-binding chemotaxis protein CheW
MNEIKGKEKKRDAEIEELEQYVTFMIGDEIYGVEVLQVREIIGMTGITHVPNSMDFMKGVINLRGTVVPVVDMRKKFRMDERGYDIFTVILIVEIKGTLIGMIVDSVSDVIGLSSESIQDTPHFSANIETDYIKCIGKSDEDLVIILDVDKILTTEEFNRIDNNRESVEQAAVV